MSNDKIDVHVAPGVQELVIRHGDAAPAYSPEPIMYKGSITAPLDFFNGRILVAPKYFDLSKTTVTADYENGNIALYFADGEPVNHNIVGSLVPSAAAQLVTSEKSYTPADLSAVLRRNLHLFASKEEGLAVVASLKGFKANMVTDVEASKEQNGSRKNLIAVSVKTEVPLGFDMNIPMFKGTSPVKVRVEMELDARPGGSVECTLFSQDVYLEMEKQKEVLIGHVVESFKAHNVTVIVK